MARMRNAHIRTSTARREASCACVALVAGQNAGQDGGLLSF